MKNSEFEDLGKDIWIRLFNEVEKNRDSDDKNDSLTC